MSAPEEFFYKYKLPDDYGLSRSDRDDLLEEIGEYIKFTMLDMIGESRSPVDGDKFDNLSTKYAKEVGHKKCNLERDGDLLDSLDFEVGRGSLKIGFFDELQAAKAYGHTTGMEGHPWLEGVTPERKIIPMGKEKFNSDIMEGIEEIIQEFIDASKD